MEKKYNRLYREIKGKILKGEYPAHQKLPSKRVMADRFGCSAVTVERAYGMLQDEGYITSRERSGYTVCRMERLSAERVLESRERLRYLEEQSACEGGDFEYSVWFKTVRRVLTEQGSRLFEKSPGRGCAVLRNALADYLARYRGMHAQPARIVIGSGAEQLYETAIKLLGRERVVGIEEPCYEQIPSVYGGMGVEVCPLKMGREGIEPEALWNNRFDLLHVTPFHSYPSGVTTSAARRYEYLSWAEKTGNYILEDDFDSEFFLPGNPIESLYSMDRAGRVIYLNTFSKSLSPAMRIGYMILPEALDRVYEEKLGQFSCTVPVMDQYILAEFISSGSFERHLNRMRRKRRQEE